MTTGTASSLAAPLLDAGLCQRLLSAALSRGGDTADVYAERGTWRSIGFEEGKVKAASHRSSFGVGIRVVAGDRTGYAFCEELDEAALLATARRAALIASAAPAAAAPLAERVGAPSRYRVERAVGDATLTERAALLARISERAYAYDPRITWVSCSLSDADETVTIAASDGTFVTDRRPMLRVVASAIATDGKRRETGYTGGGGRVGLEYFARRSPEAIANEAARHAITQLGADPCPAGTMPVVMAPGECGVLIHEAVGHGLEADFNRIGVSAYSNRVGQMVASPLVTVVDDGTVPGDRGCINVDDEGVEARKTTLIENGRLTGYLHDRTSSRLMGTELTGSGRRDGYGSVPIPRMRVTYLAGGADDPAEIVRSVPRGLYVARMGGGSVDISKGDFNFHVTEAYLIEDGRLGRPVRGATLIGNGPQVLERVTKVGNDLALADSMGTCGKEGQGCPVGLGMPTTLVSEMTVGGEA